MQQSSLAIPQSTPRFDVVLEKGVEGVVPESGVPIHLENLSSQPGDEMDIRSSLHKCREAINIRR
jgi:hypothetical protein